VGLTSSTPSPSLEEVRAVVGDDSVGRGSPLQRLRDRAREDPWTLIALPALALLLFFFGFSMFLVVKQSLTEPGPENYKLLTDDLYVHSFIVTFRAAFMVSVASLVVGYVYTYLMVAGSRVTRGLLILLLVAQFATSFLARAYAWYMILNPVGVINHALQKWGIRDQPLPLMGNDLGMIIGTTYVLLPYMVLVLYASMSQVDTRMLLAAESLGARRYQAFFRILVPATLPGIVGGVGLIFVLSLGFYITPSLLGNQNQLFITGFIVQQAQSFGNFGAAATLSLALLVSTVLGLGITSLAVARVSRRRRGVAA
jgi:putative spermidine/putrescine transport system permease protein